MDLPIRIVQEKPKEPVICVDGAFGAAGLELSHWPGNVTPSKLAHDLSTGCALRFAELPTRERERLAAGAVAIVNNHFDTDGACAAFAVRHPEQALVRRERLLAAARAGDFFAIPDEEAWAIDAVVTAFADREISPVRESLLDLDDFERRSLAQTLLLERLGGLLDGELGSYRDLWEPVLEAGRADLDDLSRATREEDRTLDLTTWTAPLGTRSTRSSSVDVFDPGRHPLFGSTGADRVLALGPQANGTTVRLLVSTLSWFDIERPSLPRPDLGGLANRLNELERTGPTDEIAWRAQATSNASPELWFGRAELPSFAEHNPVLASSRLDPARIRLEIHTALGTTHGT